MISSKSIAVNKKREWKDFLVSAKEEMDDFPILTSAG
jgi:hypothetical protein